jgi:hypothetical protein
MLSEDVVAFLRGRPIAMLGTRDHDNRPYAHESMIAAVTPGRLTVLVPEHLARGLEANVADNGAAALLVSRAPGDHRSVQVKGKIVQLDGAAVRTELFAGTRSVAEMLEAFMPRELAAQLYEKMTMLPVFRLLFDVQQVFDQTPGPGAGRRL